MAKIRFIRLAEVINKKEKKRVVSISVIPTVTGCSGTVWFTDLQLQEGEALSGFILHTEKCLLKYRENGSVKAPLYCIFVCMLGYPPNAAPQRLEKDRLGLALSKMRKVYSDNLIEMVEWCMALNPLARPQSVHALVKEMESDVAKYEPETPLTQRIKGHFDSVLFGDSSPPDPSGRKASTLSRILLPGSRP